MDNFCPEHSGTCERINDLKTKIDFRVVVVSIAFAAVSGWIGYAQLVSSQERNKIEQTAMAERKEIQSIAASERKEIASKNEAKFEKLLTLISTINVELSGIRAQLNLALGKQKWSNSSKQYNPDISP